MFPVDCTVCSSIFLPDSASSLPLCFSPSILRMAIRHSSSYLAWNCAPPRYLSQALRHHRSALPFTPCIPPPFSPLPPSSALMPASYCFPSRPRSPLSLNFVPATDFLENCGLGFWEQAVWIPSKGTSTKRLFCILLLTRDGIVIIQATCLFSFFPPRYLDCIRRPAAFMLRLECVPVARL